MVSQISVTNIIRSLLCFGCLKCCQLYAKKLADYLRSPRNGLTLLDACGTMACNRALLTQRCAITTSSLPDLVTQLDVIAQGKRKASSGDRARRVLMVFTGQGAQWAGVGQTLMAFPAYAKAVKEVDEIFKGLSGWSILERAEEIKPELAHETTYGAPVSFMVQVGLLHLLRQAGISPAMVRRSRLRASYCYCSAS